MLALVLGAALSVVWIGLPLLLGAAAACRWLVRLDRRAANRFLGTHIPPVPGAVSSAGNPWRRSLDVLSDRVLWRMVADPGHEAAARSRGCASSRSCRWRCSRRSSASACRASAAWGRSTTWDRGRSGSAWASCCWRWRRPPRCW